jgi:tRNA(Ile)-lysidine synthase
MLNPGEHVIAAVSGGPDSLALLQILILLSLEFDLSLTVAHMNHGMRGPESDAEEEFVRLFCKERRIPFRVRRVDIYALRNENRNRKSLEDLGREERYRFFTSLAIEIGASRIALGHHREDQAETVLMNLLRGSGMEGIKGMLPVRDGRFIRPLLEVSRKEILKFLGDRNIPFLEDSSNSKNIFLRNKIRHHLIPMLQEQYNPKIVDSLNRITQIVQREDKFLKTCVGNVLEDWKVLPATENGEICIEISKLLELPEALRFRMIKTLLDSYVASTQRITSSHINAIMDLITGTKPDVSIFLPGNIWVRREYDKLEIAKNIRAKYHEASSKMKESADDKYCYLLEIPCILEIKEINCVIKTSFVEVTESIYDSDFSKERKYTYFDYDKVKIPLVIRNRREGDHFQPLGMNGTKKLKTYFIDEKVPRRRRNTVPLLVDSHSIIWIAGMRLSERVRIDRETSKIAKIEII